MSIPPRFIAGLLLPAIAIALLNYSQDPLLLLLPSSHFRIAYGNLNRMKHAFSMNKIRPDFLVIGSSRVRSFPYAHPVFENKSAYIANISAGRMIEIAQYAHFAQQLHPLKQAVIGLHVESFVSRRVSPDFDPDRISDNAWIRKTAMLKDLFFLLYSKETTISSLNILKKKFLPPQPAAAPNVNDFLSLSYCDTRKQPPSLEPHIAEALRLSFQDFRSILDEARQNHTDLRLFITPFHASRYEMPIENQANVVDTYWKRALVEMLALEAADHHSDPFPLWDFSGYNTINTEALLSRTIYFDSSHINSKGSSMVLDRMFHTCPTPCTLPQDFGVLLTSENIDEHLKELEKRRMEYHRQNPEIVASWNRLIRRRCAELARPLPTTPPPSAGSPSRSEKADAVPPVSGVRLPGS